MFEIIRSIRPTRLFIVADGPRDLIEENLCNETRKIVETIDWPCQVLRNYSDNNLGCRQRISSGINWVFDNVEEAIILEDDCFPHPSFFPYCESLLDRYRDTENVFHISGSSFLKVSNQCGNTSDYYYSAIPQIWGWATWRRAWKRYDKTLSSWPEVKKTSLLKKAFGIGPVIDYWEYVFDRMYTNKYDTWDIAWTFTLLKENGLAITPTVNLISNIGYGNLATHTRSLDKGMHLINLPTYPIRVPPTAPVYLKKDIQADLSSLQHIFGIKITPRTRTISVIKKYVPEKIKRYLSSFFSKN